MKILDKKIEDFFSLIVGKHPYNTVFSYNWLFVKSILGWYKLNQKKFKKAVVIDLGGGNCPYFPIISKNIKRYISYDFYDKEEKLGKLWKEPLINSPVVKIKPNWIVSNQVLPEITDVDSYFQKIKQLSGDNTKLLITAPFIQPLGNNDRLRLSPWEIKNKLKMIGFKIDEYKNCGYFFISMATSFNMLLVQKNDYGVEKPSSSIVVIKALILSPLIAIINLFGLFLDKLLPLKRMPANIIIVASKAKENDL